MPAKKPALRKPRRLPDAPDPERVTMNLPDGTRARVMQAIALMQILGDDAPGNLTAFAVKCMDEKIKDVLQRAQTAGIKFKART